jgi:hypothetical protein
MTGADAGVEVGAPVGTEAAGDLAIGGDGAQLALRVALLSAVTSGGRGR